MAAVNWCAACGATENLTRVWDMVETTPDGAQYQQWSTIGSARHYCDQHPTPNIGWRRDGTIELLGPPELLERIVIVGKS